MFDVVWMANVQWKFLLDLPLPWGLNSSIKACTTGTFTHRAILLALSLNLWIPLSQ